MFKLLLLFILASSCIAKSQIVEQVIIQNNKKTKEWIIRRELLVKEGDTLTNSDSAKLKRSAENLYNTHLFNDVRVVDTIVNNRKTIFIDLQERWYLWPYIILEQADRNLATFIHSQEWERVNYGIMVVKHNFRGRNEDFGFKFRLGFRQQFGINYYVPMINNNLQRLGLLFDASVFRQKSFFYNIVDYRYTFVEFDYYAFIENRFKAGFVFRPKHNIKHYIVTSLHNFNINDTVQNVTNTLFGSPKKQSNWMLFDYVFEQSTLNYVLYPTKGHSIICSISAGTDFNGYAWEGFQANLSNHQPWGNRFVYSSAVFGEYFLNDLPPVGLRRSIGNNYYFRGYEDFVWNAQGAFGTRQQLSWNFLKKKKYHVQSISSEKFNKPFIALYATAFSDIGIITQTKPKGTNPFMTTIGTGIDLVSYYDIIFRFESVINIDKKYFFNIHMGTVF